MKDVWWIIKPPDIKMTDERARSLLNFEVRPESSAEETFIEANANTIIPKRPYIIIPDNQKLSLHKPGTRRFSVIGED